MEAMNSPGRSFPGFLGIPVVQQKKLILIAIAVIILASYLTNAQSETSSSTNVLYDSTDTGNNFQPSLAVVIGVLAVMFSLTFLLLLYAKCCHRPSSLHYLNRENFGALPRSLSSLSGVDKTVIESLPFFRFSALKGWRHGLECSICLSKFEDVEILRLLPKCKHAFHIDCVDEWLGKHLACPLCRQKVEKEDVNLFAHSSSLRFLNNQSDPAHEGSNLELFVEREGSTRFGSRRSFGKIEQEKNDHDILEDDEEILHKFNHRIIISDYDHDLMMKNRWSNLTSSDILCLKSEMIPNTKLANDHDHRDDQMDASVSNVFDHGPDVETVSSHGHDHRVTKIKEEIRRKTEFEMKIKKFPGGEIDIGSTNEPRQGKLVQQRSMSEIVVHPRFLDVESGNKEANLNDINVKEQRLKRLWLPIARRTVQWFANRDRQPQMKTNSQV